MLGLELASIPRAKLKQFAGKFPAWMPQVGGAQPTFPRKACSPLPRIDWLARNSLLIASRANALAANPPKRLAFKFGTTVVEVTFRGGVPLATVEISWWPLTVPFTVSLPVTVSFPVTVGNVCPEANVICPLLLIERPVSPGVPVPEANSKLSFPEAVLRPGFTGSACQRKC